jgi:hypothetical protein
VIGNRAQRFQGIQRSCLNLGGKRAVITKETLDRRVNVVPLNL